MKNVVIRVDASLSIGTGHVMRCLTLAGKLSKQGKKVFFVTRDWPGNMAAHIREKEYPVSLLPALHGASSQSELQLAAEVWQEDAAETGKCIEGLQLDTEDILLVVDHYALDEKWERALRPMVRKIMVIDDLANRPHDCDILLDQNYYKNMEGRYQGLVPPHCRLKLGPKYALLREEFYHARKKLKVRDGVVRHLFIFFGGSDPTQETMKALRAVERLNRPDLSVDVVVGVSNPHRAEIERFCNRLSSALFHYQVDNMAELMAGADLAIGAGGTAIWERCFLGLPSLVIAVAENQVETVKALAEAGVVVYLGQHDQVSVERITDALQQLMGDPRRLVELSRRGIGMIEGTL